MRAILPLLPCILALLSCSCTSEFSTSPPSEHADKDASVIGDAGADSGGEGSAGADDGGAGDGGADDGGASLGDPALLPNWQRDYVGWIVIPDNEGPHAPELYPDETFDLTFVGTQENSSRLAFRCYEREAAPGICITAHCAYGGQSALFWARWCGAGETAFVQRPDIVAAVFHVPPMSIHAPAGQGRGVVLEPNPYWHASQPPPAVCFTGQGIKANGGGWVMVYSTQPDVEFGAE